MLVSGLAEFACWLLLIAVEVLPRLNAVTSLAQLGALPSAGSGSSFFDSPTGAALLEAYETLVFNEIADADDWFELAAALLVLYLVLRRCRTEWRKCCGGDDERRGRGERGRTRRWPGSARKYARVHQNSSFDDDETDDEYSADEENPKSAQNPKPRPETRRF